MTAEEQKERNAVGEVGKAHGDLPRFLQHISNTLVHVRMTHVFTWKS